MLEAHLTVPFVMLALTAFLTAFYMFRVVFLAFFGRGLGDSHAHHHVPGLMSLVCWTLTVLTIATGVAMARQVLSRGHHGDAPPWLPAFSLGLAGGGILLAYLMYQRRALDPARFSAALAPLDWAARRRYGIDAVFVGLYRFVLLAFSHLVGWLDRYIVDGLLNVVSAWTLRAGDRLRRIQSGLAQDYLYGVAFGVLLLFVLAQWRLR